MRELEIYKELKEILAAGKNTYYSQYGKEILDIVRSHLVDKLNKAFDTLKEIESDCSLEVMDKIAKVIDELNA